MNFFDKIARWFVAFGKLLFDFTKTESAKVIKEYGDDLLRIVKEAALMGGTGDEKKVWAVAQLMALIPGLSLYVAETSIQVAYATWKESEFVKDTDGDGVPDYIDVCKELGAPPGGCVTEDGCPDSDCDGVADKDDACPDDPDCQ